MKTFRTFSLAALIAVLGIVFAACSSAGNVRAAPVTKQVAVTKVAKPIPAVYKPAIKSTNQIERMALSDRMIIKQSALLSFAVKHKVFAVKLTTSGIDYRQISAKELPPNLSAGVIDHFRGFNNNRAREKV